jgi:hypothetical protein
MNMHEKACAGNDQVNTTHQKAQAISMKHKS